MLYLAGILDSSIPGFLQAWFGNGFTDLKWRFADEELVAEDPEAPEVNLLIMHVSLDHLCNDQEIKGAQGSHSNQESYMKKFLAAVAG